MNIRQYLQTIAYDGQRFGSVDERELPTLQPGQALFVVTENNITLTAKSYMIDHVNHRRIHGEYDFVIGLISAQGDEKINIETIDYNVDQHADNYGKKLSRLFTNIEAAQRYLESVIYVNDANMDAKETGDKLLQARVIKRHK